MNELKKGSLVWLPSYDELIKRFGETIIDGETVLKTKPLWDMKLRMKTMCSDYHTIKEINHDSIVIAHPSGTTYSFAKEIFTEFKEKKDIPTNRNKTIDINNILFRQMRNRYDFVEYERLKPSQKGFGIIDSIYPNELWKKESGKLSPMLRTGTVAISEKIASDLGVPQLHISELVGFFGYTKTNITKLLLSVKKKKFNILVIGFGGTGTNFTHWMSKMVEWTNTHYIFNEMVVADNDYFDSTNLLRVPFILPEKAPQVLRKVMYFNDYARISKQIIKSHDFVNKKNLSRNHIYYGAPDLKTRELLDKENIPFIAATHRDNSCALMLRPKMDTDLMVETYGKIALTPFFMNHIRMTIAFLEYLGKDETTFESMKGKEESIFDFNFAETHEDEIDNGIRVSGRTVYPIIANTRNTVNIDIGE